MYLFISAPEFNYNQSNITKVRLHLSTGSVEILDQHRDLLGKITTNMIEIETNFENRIEKSIVVVENAIILVSTKTLRGESKGGLFGWGAGPKGTGIYVYARQALEITANSSIEDLTKIYDTNMSTLELCSSNLAELPKDSDESKEIEACIILLKEQKEFFQKAIFAARMLKN